MPLDISIDARSAGLSGKLAANMNPNGGAAAYNPAFVDSTSLGVVNVSYLNYFAGIQMGSIHGVIRNRGKHTLHVGARFSSFGKFEGYDSSGWPTGEFSGGEVVRTGDEQVLNFAQPNGRKYRDHQPVFFQTF